MFYLTTLPIHYYLRLYGLEHMVKDHSDSEEGEHYFYLSIKVYKECIFIVYALTVHTFPHCTRLSARAN